MDPASVARYKKIGIVAACAVVLVYFALQIIRTLVVGLTLKLELELEVFMMCMTAPLVAMGVHQHWWIRPRVEEKQKLEDKQEKSRLKAIAGGFSVGD